MGGKVFAVKHKEKEKSMVALFAVKREERRGMGREGRERETRLVESN